MAFHADESSSGVPSNITTSTSSFAVEYQAIRSSLYFGDYLQFPTRASLRNQIALDVNPFGITVDDFNLVCMSTTSSELRCS